MVGGKVELKKIEDVKKLQLSFTGRRKVLMKKANDLSILCDVDIALIVFSNTGDVYHFSSRSMEQILSRYGYIVTDRSRQREEEEPQPLLCSSQENGDAVLRKDESMTSELKRLQLAIERLKGKELEGISFSDLISLESLLNDSLLSVKDQKTILLNEVERSRLQEKRTLEENQLLRKQLESMLGRGSSGAQVEDDEENDNEEHYSDTSLQLGWGKRKKLKFVPP